MTTPIKFRTKPKPCPGPGHNGETCGRPVVSNDLCHNHSRHYREGGYSLEALKPLCGPHGRKFEAGAVRLEVRNVPGIVMEALELLGEKLPPTDKREVDPRNRAARHLAAALAAGAVKFKAAWDPVKKPMPLPVYEYGKAPTGRVDLRHVPEAERKALEALGARVTPPFEGHTNTALRGIRYLIHAYANDGLRLLGDFAP